MCGLRKGNFYHEAMITNNGDNSVSTVNDEHEAVFESIGSPEFEVNEIHLDTLGDCDEAGWLTLICVMSEYCIQVFFFSEMQFSEGSHHKDVTKNDFTQQFSSKNAKIISCCIVCGFVLYHTILRLFHGEFFLPKY